MLVLILIALLATTSACAHKRPRVRMLVDSDVRTVETIARAGTPVPLPQEPATATDGGALPALTVLDAPAEPRPAPPPQRVAEPAPLPAEPKPPR